MHISVLDMGCANRQANISHIIMFYNRSCIEPGTVIEYCILEEGVSIGRNCLLSNLHVPVSFILSRGGPHFLIALPAIPLTLVEVWSNTEQLTNHMQGVKATLIFHI